MNDRPRRRVTLVDVIVVVVLVVVAVALLSRCDWSCTPVEDAAECLVSPGSLPTSAHAERSPIAGTHTPTDAGIAA